MKRYNIIYEEIVKITLIRLKKVIFLYGGG